MENCAIKIIKKLSCCITGKSIRSTSQQQQQQQLLQLQGLPEQQQQTREVKQLETPALLPSRPGAQSGTTTLKIKRCLVVPPSQTATTTAITSEVNPKPDQDTVDYASALVKDHGGNMVQLPKSHTMRVDKKKADDPSGKSEEDSERSSEKDQVVEIMKQFESNTCDGSVTVADKGGDEMEENEEEDPYAELDLYLERVKVCAFPLMDSYCYSTSAFGVTEGGVDRE